MCVRMAGTCANRLPSARLKIVTAGYFDPNSSRQGGNRTRTIHIASTPEHKRGGRSSPQVSGGEDYLLPDFRPHGDAHGVFMTLLLLYSCQRGRWAVAPVSSSRVRAAFTVALGGDKDRLTTVVLLLFLRHY